MDGAPAGARVSSMQAARTKWHLTAEDTGGRLVRGEVWLPAGTPLHPLHEHGIERVELLAGSMELVLGGVGQVLRRGDVAHIPAGTRHCWGNAGSEVLHFMFELELNG
jgi:quercetin dioxygenase-like cupin family protein